MALHMKEQGLLFTEEEKNYQQGIYEFTCSVQETFLLSFVLFSSFQELKSRGIGREWKGNNREGLIILTSRRNILNATEKDINPSWMRRKRLGLLDLQLSLMLWQDKEKTRCRRKTSLKNETCELFIMEMNLKEELDSLRG